MASQTRKSKHPVLKMPLDLSLPIDKEVYEIFEGFASGVEAKNFLCSAILYYTRSPLVLSANALTESLGKVNLDERFESMLSVLGEIKSIVGCFSDGSVVKSNLALSPPIYESPVVDSITLGALTSLKEKFKL